ncbi:MAG: tRNA glutamyl-Q(34) synthetase GluQRS [Deltaproteobacteria bacterium]|jgi:glutamyl-tRNA synthetase|nr:tRNA glutamyl-Q(34) synthetase GluQRS [Deltaproteobacteria bacterium]
MKNKGNPPPRGRLAPSPTGFLHLGNAWSFLLAWLGTRSAGGELIFRIEDVDLQRYKAEYAAALAGDLLWLGLDWDYGPGRASLPVPLTQSLRLERYAAGLEFLENLGLLYPCFCKRRELRSLAGAPQAGDSLRPYPGRCRAFSPEERSARQARGENYALRLRFEERCSPYLRVNDLCLGSQLLTPDEAGGDFALRRSDGVFAYQLAVVMDDLDMGVNQVVRGRDILPSTPGQMFLFDCFGAAPPRYAHIPLLRDHEGARLAKRHASLSLRSLRAAGVRAENIAGFLAWWGGLRNSFHPASPGELLQDFAFSRVKTRMEPLPENMAEVLLRGRI